MLEAHTTGSGFEQTSASSFTGATSTGHARVMLTLQPVTSCVWNLPPVC